MNKKITDIQKIDTRIANIRKDKRAFAQEYIDRINKTLPSLPDREPTHEGNITMKEHFLQIKKEIETSPNEYADREIMRLEEMKTDPEVLNAEDRSI